MHEHLSRGDLSRVPGRAQYAWRRFLKGLRPGRSGLSQLEDTPFEGQARLALLAIYERSRDWPHAAGIARKMHDAHQGDFSTRQAHYLCEQAQACIANNDRPGALALLNHAVATAPEAAGARIVPGCNT